MFTYNSKGHGYGEYGEVTSVGKDESCVGHEASRIDPCSNLAGNTTSGTSGVEENSDLYGS